MTSLLNEWGAPEASALSRALQQRQAEGLPTQDLITAPPQDFGFCFSPDLLQQIMSRAARQCYRYGAHALGRPDARQAVADFHGGGATAHNVLLTPGTSLAYFYLFRLLARPHGEVLVPAPTYPLFDDIARLAGLRVRYYHLQETAPAPGRTRWATDAQEVAFQVSPRTVAIVVVSPHNPTGTIMNNAEMQAVCDVANRHKLPVIFDEVFRTFTADEHTDVPRPAECGANLSVTLNGLSKSHYLPALKAGWMVAEGDANHVRPLLNALEYISDTFLPVSEPVQAALPDLLRGDGYVEMERLCRLHRAALSNRLAQPQMSGVRAPEAGPYLVRRLPDGTNDEQAALTMLRKFGAYFHPASLYGFGDTWPGLVGTVYNPAPWPEFMVEPSKI